MGGLDVYIHVFLTSALVGGEFSLLHVVQTDSGVNQPPIQKLKGVHFPGVKRQGREADHSPPASAEVKKMWIYTSSHGVMVN
jgi:hypothetical protein